MRQHFLTRVISLALAVAMLVSLIPAALVSAAVPSQFVDFPTGWSKEAMTAAVNNGLLQGKSETTIEPQSYLTRAEMAAIINRAFGAYLATDISMYTDVQKGAWYYNDMALAVNMQTFEGNGTDKLYPDNNITREEVFAVIARALVYDTDDYSPLSRFNDGQSVSGWAKPYASALAARGYINGDESGNLYPASYITREEFAQIMHNIIKTYISAPGEYDSVAEGGVMIRSAEVTLVNVTINGDLVLGDGVGFNDTNITNVDVNGRMIVRSGNITLKNTTTDMPITVKNVNGTVHFNNYKTEAVFEEVDERTHTTYLTNSGMHFGGGGSGGGGGGGGGGSTTTSYQYKVNYYLQKADLTDAYDLDTARSTTATVTNGTVVSADMPEIDGFILDAEKSAASQNVTINSNNIVLNVYYKRETKTVSFNYNYQGAPAPVEVTVAKGYGLGEFNKMPQMTDREDYTFIGWSTDPAATTADFTGETVVSEDKTLYAVWQIKKFDVTFKYEDGVTADLLEADIVWGTEFSAVKPIDPTRDDYNFGGWYTEAEGNGTRYNDDTLVKEDVTLYAYWTLIPTYTITFKYDDDGITPDYEVPDVVENTLFGTIKPVDPTREDYDFGGWFTEPDGQGTEYEDDTPVTADSALYAYWTLKPVIPVTYTVTFDYNYTGAPVATQIPGISYNTEFASIITAEISNNIVNRTEGGVIMCFRGWNTSADGNGVWYTDTKKITRDITLYAMWEEVGVVETYTVTFNYNYTNAPDDATVDGLAYNTEFGTIVTDAIKANLADRDENGVTMTFKGWNTSEDGNGVWYEDATKVTGNITLYAIWAEDIANTTYTVTFNYNYNPEWANGEATQVVYGTAFKDAIPADVTTALNTYKAELDGVKAFMGWNTKADGTGAMYDDDTPITDNITLYAIWADINPDTTYTVTFDYNYKPEWANGEATQVVYGTAFINVVPGEVNTALEAYKNELYGVKAFMGWNTKADGTGAMYGDNTPITDNITLYAIWADINPDTTYTVTFNYNHKPEWANGEATQVVYGTAFMNVVPGEVNTALEAYKNELYGVKAFMGWNTNADGTGVMYKDSTKITANTTLYAIWADVMSDTTYTVTFNYNHKPEWVNSEATQVVYGTAFMNVIPADVTTALNTYKTELDGVKVFKGWNTNADGTGVMYEDNTKITGNTTLYAIWADVIADTTYTVIFNYNYKPEWVNDEATQVVYGTAFKDVIPADVTTALNTYKAELDGVKVFKGWNTKADGTGIMYEDDTQITDNITLYAIWADVVADTTYTVTFNYNYKPEWANYEATQIVYGTAFKDAVPGEVNTALEAYKNELFDVKVFKGWNTKADGTGTMYEDENIITDNITLYAIWADINPDTTYTVTFNYNYKPEWTNGEATQIVYGTAFKDVIPANVTAALEAYKAELDGVEIFKGWNTNADGTGAMYEDDTRITGDITLYAIWEPVITYMVTFNYNYDGAPEAVDIDKVLLGTELGTIVTDEIKANLADRVVDDITWGFKGWNTKADGNGTWYEDTTAVNETVILYAIWYDKSTYYNVRFYYGYAATDEYKEYIKVSESDMLAGATFDEPTVTKMYVDNGYTEEADLLQKGFYDPEVDKYHMIAGQLRYLDGTTWKIFKTDDPATTDVNEGTPITGDMEIYFTFANIAVFADVNAFGVDTDVVTSYVPYNSSVRLMDTLKDFVWLSRIPVENALVHTGAEDKLIQKVAEKTNLIDENGNIKIVNFDLLISRVIDADDIDKKAKEYLENIIRTGTEEELNNLIAMVDVKSFIKSIGLKKLIDIVGHEAVKDELVRPEIREELITFIRELINTDDEFRNTVIDKAVKDKDIVKSYLDKDVAKEKVINEITTNEVLIDHMLANEDLKDMLVERMKDDNTFLSAILDNPSMHDKVVGILRNQEKAAFIDMLNNSHALRVSIIDDIKGDGASVPQIIADSMDTIITEVKQTQDFKDILTTDNNTRDDIVNTVKTSTEFKNVLKDVYDDTNIAIVNEVLNSQAFKDILTDVTDATNVQVVSEILGSQAFKDILTDSTNATNIKIVKTVKDSTVFNETLTTDNTTRDNIINQLMNTIAFDPALHITDEDKKDYIIELMQKYADGTLQAEDAEAFDKVDAEADNAIINLLADYADGTISDVSLEAEITAQATAEIQTMLADYADGTISDVSLEAEITAQATVEVQTMLADYADGNLTGNVADKISEQADVKTKELLENYANGTLTNASIEAKINDKVADVIEDSVETYFTDVDNMNTDLKDVIDTYVEDWIVDTITDYLNDTMTNPAIEADVEAEIFNYIKHYLNGTLEFTDTEAQQFVEDVKVHFIEILKDEPVSTLEEPVENYLMNPANKDKVSEMVINNYSIVEGYIVDNLTSDDQVVIFVRDYVEENIYSIDDDTMNMFIDTYFDDIVDNDMIDKFVVKYENDDEVYELLSGIITAETVCDYIIDTREKDALNGTNNLKTLIDEAIEMLENLEYYQEFMACFRNGDETYHVDKENIVFVEAVGHAIYNFDFDEIVQILRDKGFGKIIDKIGLDQFEEIFNESKADYYNGILDIKDKIDADETYSEEYKASMSVTVDPMELVKSLYDEHKQKLYNKLSTVERSYYDENPYLKQFVEQDLFAEFFNYDASMKDDVYTGYSIRPFMNYYDIMYERLLLADKALCWYGELAEDEYAELEDLAMNGIVKAINKAVELLNKLHNDEEIFRGYTVEELADKYEKASELFDKYEDKYRKALDKFANSKLNRTYDRTFIESKYAPYNIADIITGKDEDNRFYVDSVYNAIGDRLDRFSMEYTESANSGRYAIDKYGKDFRDNSFYISRYLD